MVPSIFFDVINDSFHLIPPDRFLNPNFFLSDNMFNEKMIKLMNRFMELSIQLAAPAMIIILMTDFFLGIVNRLAPQVQIIFLGLGLKSMVPIFVMSLGWYLFLEQASKEAITWVYETREAVVVMGTFKAGTEPFPPANRKVYLVPEKVP
ncbi:flagellar biosynthetic protein FliR [Chlamydiales bacterium]|nr:flagellar biosynthetic protein FliR [Chlamydiales bacterium]